MPWIVTDEQESEEEMPQKGWVVVDEEEMGQPGRVSSRKPKDPEFSASRLAGAAGRGALMGTGGFGSFLDAFGLQAKETLPGQEARWSVESQILDKMQDPNYKPSFTDLYALSGDDDIVPDYHRLPNKEQIADVVDEATSGRFIPQTALERIVGKGAETAVDFAYFSKLFPGGGSAARELGTGALFGIGEQIAEESGKGQVGQFATGVGFSMAPWAVASGRGLLSKGKDVIKDIFKANRIPEGTPKFLEEVGTKKALADLQLSQKDLTGRTAQISEDLLQKFEDQAGRVAEPSFKDVGTFRSADIEREIINRNQNAILDAVAPAAKTKKEAWNGIKQFVEENFNTVEREYSALYEAAENMSKDIGVIPRKTAQVAGDIYKGLEESLIRIPEESGVKATIRELADKLAPMAEGNLVEFPMQQLISTKRSVNRAINRSRAAQDVIPNVNDLLYPISRALKEDILEGMAKRPGVKQIYENAENVFAKAQDVFNNDSVLKLRRTQNPEDIGSYFTNPSNLERLNKALGGNKQVKDFTDRLVLENIAKKDINAARELSNEMKDYLGSKAQNAMDKILEYGDRLTTPGQQAIARGEVLKDLQKSFDTGSRPDYVLKLMQNDKGYKLVEDTLARSPKGKRAWKALQRQSLEDMMESTLDKSGKIDFEKAKDILKNPQARKIVVDAVGEEGLKFFEKLEGYGKNFSQNMEFINKQQPGVIKGLVEKYLPKQAAAILVAMAPFYPGAALKMLAVYAGKEGVELAKRARLYRILESPEARDAIKSMASKGNVTPALIRDGFKRFGQVMGTLEDSESK